MGSFPSKRAVAPAIWEFLPGRLLATYQLLPRFQYSDKLEVYVDDLEKLDPRIPPPGPATSTKTQVFDVSHYADVDKRAIKAPAKYHTGSMQELVNYLIAGYDDTLSKIRVIYRWITCQPIDNFKFRKEPPQHCAVYQLWRIQSKKGNYAQLVSLMCRYANIPCVIIHGALKGSTYEVGDTIDEDLHYGEWNAVQVDKQWRFINAYWGTCAEGADEHTDTGLPSSPTCGDEFPSKLVYCCDENYFLTDPDQMVATHLPSNPKWQLRKTVLSLNDFQNMTFIKDRFFNLKIQLLTHQSCVIRDDTGEVELRFGVPRHLSLCIDFQYLFFRIQKEFETRYDRYVFLHQTNNHETVCVRLRSPVADTFRFELVGKDVTITDETYDYDWIAIYKVIFSKGLKECDPFPPTPDIGWGPGRVTRQYGLAPLSHFSGEIQMDDYGKCEIRFGAVNKINIGHLRYATILYTGCEKQTEIPDQAVHRVDNGDVIVNALTRECGQYVLKLFVRNQDETGNGREFCSYFVTSKQKERNGAFPRGFSERLGPKNPAFSTSGLSPTVPSGFIRADTDEVSISFLRRDDIELSVNLSGDKVRSAEAPKLLCQEEAADMVNYTARLPETGQYGIRIRGTRVDNAVHDDLYDYVIDYRKVKKRSKRETTIKLEAEQYDSSESFPDVVRRRVRMAVEEENIEELTSAIKDMRSSKLPTLALDLLSANQELLVMKLRKALVTAIRDKDVDQLKQALKDTKTAELETRLGDEVLTARLLLDRLKKLQRLLHAVLSLEQSTIAEIRGYSNPPSAVKRVLMATLLLLGHWEEETCYWKNIQMVLGKTGKDSIKRIIKEFKLEHVPLEVAVGARDLLQGFSIEQVRLVSAGAATFYVWVKGVVEEIERRAGDDIVHVRPRTSKARRKSRGPRERSFIIREKSCLEDLGS